MKCRSILPLPILVLILMLLVLARPAILRSRQKQDAAPQLGLLVSASGFAGVILPAEARELRGLYPPGTHYWTPSEADVLTLEQRLRGFLTTSKDPRMPEIIKTLDKYKRQYRGVMLGDRKLIIVRFFCDAQTKDLMGQEFIVLDGDTCFFNLRYSPKTRTFSHIRINGSA
jgi:hypothetical protein